MILSDLFTLGGIGCIISFALFIQLVIKKKIEEDAI